MVTDSEITTQLLCCIYSTGQINISTFHISCSMQPKNVLAQILNVQHSKSGTPARAGAMLME